MLPYRADNVKIAGSWETEYQKIQRAYYYLFNSSEKIVPGIIPNYF